MFLYCFYDFQRITLQYALLPLSLPPPHSWETVCQVSDFLKNVTMFPILYYEYDCNTVCHTNFITTHSLLYRLATMKQLY